MKMAKASEADLDMAMELTNAFDSLTRRWGAYVPEKVERIVDDNESERFDLSDDEQCRRVLEYLIELVGRASLVRVVFGMAVVCDPRNALLDPEADTLEHHPDREKAVQFRDEVRDLLYGAHPTCCGKPDMDTLGDAEIVKRLRALVPAPVESVEVPA